MGLASLIARRSVLRRPGRTLFSILGVALGVATVVGVTTLDHATIEGYARPRQAQDRPDIELVGEGAIGSPEALAQLEGVSAAARFFQNEVLVESPLGRSDGAEFSLRTQLYAIDAEHAATLGTFGVEVGADLDPAADVPEVLIGSALVRDQGLSVGDEVLVSRPARTSRKRCENGVLVDVGTGEVDRPPVARFRVAGVLTREGVGRAAAGNVVVLDYDAALTLFRGVDVDARVWARKDPGVDLERLRRSLSATYSYDLNRGVVIGQAADERAFRTGVRMLGLLALVLGLYVIFHTLSMSLKERVLEVGTLHALGSTRRQIGRVFFTEAALLSGAGALLGAVLGVLLAWTATRVGITTLGVGKYVQGFSVPWGTVTALALVGFAVALVGSIYPLVAIGGANTLRALRGDESLAASARSQRTFHLVYAGLLAFLVPGLYLVLVPVVGELTGELIATLLGIVGVLTAVVLLSLFLPTALSLLCRIIAGPLTRFFPLAGRLATRAMQDAPARIGVSACAIGLVAAGFVGLHGMTESLRAEVTTWADEAVDDKVWVRGIAPVEFEALSEHLLRFPGVVGVEKAAAKQYAPFLVVGASGPRMSAYGPFAAEPELLSRFQDERTIVLSRRIASDLDYAVGDVVKMKSRDGQVLSYEVLAVSDAYGYWTSPDERLYGVISERWMENDFCLASEIVNEVAVRFDRSAPMTMDGHLGVLDAALRDMPRVGDAFALRTGVDVRDYALADIGRDFVVFDLLLALMAVLAGLGVLNGLLLATLERTRELGVLRALGASRGQVGGAMALESLVVGLVGGGLGVLLGIAAVPFVVRALESIAGLELEVRSAGGWIPATLIGSIALALVASLYPIRRAHAADAVRAVRTR